MLNLIFTLFIVIGATFASMFYKDEINQTYHDIAYFSFCEEPISYKIGSIDKQFAVTEDIVINEIAESADIWNTYLGKDIFTYSENADLKVNLVYDERQRALNKVANQQTTVIQKKDDLTKQILSYEEKLQQLKIKSSELNNQIKYWNSKGGAPEEIYNKLVEEQSILNKQIDELNETVRKINDASKSVNEKIDILNGYVNEFNNLIDTHPEEGIFDPNENKIDIYFYDSKNRFIHTVAHELGHSLGLSHVDDPKAILNPITSENIILTEDDTNEIDSFCAQRNKFEYIYNNSERLIKSLFENAIKQLN